MIIVIYEFADVKKVKFTQFLVEPELSLLRAMWIYDGEGLAKPYLIMEEYSIDYFFLLRRNKLIVFVQKPRQSHKARSYC